MHLVEAFAALCRGDLDTVVGVLEWRIAVDGGRFPRGDYPLGVAPELVEAYLGLGRRDDAVALAGQHAECQPGLAGARGPRPRRPARRHARRRRRGGGHGVRDRVRSCTPTRSGPRGPGCCTAPGCAGPGAGWRPASSCGRRRPPSTRSDWTAGPPGATAELAATGQRPRRGPRDGDQLTSQETRVALLVARGLSNRDVAAALFVSPRTVEHHVSSVLRKRGLRSRTELAAAFGERAD